jgi:hypothetical protein
MALENVSRDYTELHRGCSPLWSNTPTPARDKNAARLTKDLA